MGIIIDADVVIGGEKGSFDLRRWLKKYENEEFELAAITVAELWHGVERAAPEQKEVRRNYLQPILQVLPIIPYTETTALEHARIWAELASSGNMIGYYDLIVAATGIERKSSVATFNGRQFSKVKGLKVIDLK